MSARIGACPCWSCAGVGWPFAAANSWKNARLSFTFVAQNAFRSAAGAGLRQARTSPAIRQPLISSAQVRLSPRQPGGRIVKAFRASSAGSDWTPPVRGGRSPPFASTTGVPFVVVIRCRVVLVGCRYAEGGELRRGDLEQRWHGLCG